MVKLTKYNGWTNRETWLVNLYFGDSFESMVREDVENGEYSDDVEALAEGFAHESDKKEYIGGLLDDIAERYEQFVDEMIQPDLDGLSSFLSDFIDLGLIDWNDLAHSVVQELFL